MRAITGSAYSRYAGLLLPIEPPEDFFRPIDVKPEDVLSPNGQQSAHKRPRSLARFLIAFCTGVAAILLCQSYGDAAREVIGNSYPWFGWLAPRPALTTQNPRPHDVIGLATPPAPSAEKLNAISSDLDKQNADKTATTIGAAQEPTLRSADQTATGQDQMTRNTDQTATSVDQAPAANASGVTVEGQADGASSRLDIKPTEAKPPQTLSEKRKLLSAASEQDASCFPSASAVPQNDPGGWPTWTLKAPGHEGTVCWYAAARPRGSDHRRVGTTENGLAGSPAQWRQGWRFGLP